MQIETNVYVEIGPTIQNVNTFDFNYCIFLFAVEFQKYNNYVQKMCKHKMYNKYENNMLECDIIVLMKAVSFFRFENLR